MKKTIHPALLIVSFLLLASFTALRAQSSQAIYKDNVVENPNADADIKVVGDLVNSLVAGDFDKVKMLLADGYKGYGPAPTDSTTAEKTISGWRESNKTQSNRKISFVPATFKVVSGDLQGEWVSLWGDYSFTESGKDVKFPFQYTAHVTNGKIDGDRVYYDRMYIMQTLGYKVTPPDSGK